MVGRARASRVLYQNSLWSGKKVILAYLHHHEERPYPNQGVLVLLLFSPEARLSLVCIERAVPNQEAHSYHSKPNIFLTVRQTNQSVKKVVR